MTNTTLLEKPLPLVAQQSSGDSEFAPITVLGPENQTLPCSVIQIGNNPRRKFDSAKLAELRDTIRAMGGLLQAILVRPLINEPGQFQLIAGERRLRCYIEIYGPESQIPVLIRSMTDEEANAAALTENVARVGMTPVEEAEAAARTLADCAGDRAEAAKRLGWKPHMLDARLGLMNAIPAVREALQEDKILLGHAELLAILRKEIQTKALAELLSQPKPMSVSEMKAGLDRVAMKLEAAIFDKKDCVSCPHNSDVQNTLFAEAISEGSCTNSQCFNEKSEAEINSRAEALKSEYQLVRIFRVGENLTLIKLAADGPNGVGTEQAKACKTCKSYGAVVSTVPDKYGKVFTGMCMDVPCNTAHVKALQEANAGPSQETGGNTGTTGETGSTTAVQQVANAKSSAAPSTKSKSVITPPSSEPSTRVREYREQVWRQIFALAIPKLSVVENRSVLMALCMTRPSVINSQKLKSQFSKITSSELMASPVQLSRAFLDLENTQQSQLLAQIPANVEATLFIKDVTDFLNSFEIKVKDYWKFGDEFCQLLTVNELDAVFEEIGVKKAMGDEYAKAHKSKRADFIKSVLAVKDFDFAGRVPKLMSY
jgi:ParB family chromosome partitioning protein